MPPRVAVRLVGCRPADGDAPLTAAGDARLLDAGDARRWRVSWDVHNLGASPLELETAWIPHGRFRGDARLPLDGTIAPDAARQLEFAVNAAEAPGTVVDNAFFILRVRLQGRAWRIFVRMRVEFDAAGVPVPVVEAVTTQSLE